MYGDDVNLFEKKDSKGKMMETDENQNMIRILVWPNITFDIERLHQDSYVQTIYKMILGLQSRRDLWWELVLPLTSEPFTLFDPFDNVDVVQIKCHNLFKPHEDISINFL